MKKILAYAGYIFILIIMLLVPELSVSAEETYTFKDYSAVMEVTKETNIRTEPSLNGEKVGFYPAGTEITVNGTCNETGWYRIEYEGETRYLSNIYLKLLSVNYTFSYINGRMFLSDETNIRKEPRLEGEKVGALPAGEEFLALGRCNETGWYRILYQQEYCYISDKYVMDYVVVDGKYSFKTISPVDIRKWPNDYSEIMGHLDEDFYYMTIGLTDDGTYYQIQYGNIRGFIPAYAIEVFDKIDSKVSTTETSTESEETAPEPNGPSTKEALWIIVFVCSFVVLIFILLMISLSQSENTKSFRVGRTPKKKSDFSIFGIDWDGDGKASMEDDFLTMEMMEDDF